MSSALLHGRMRRSIESTRWLRAHPGLSLVIAILGSLLATLLRFMLDPVLPGGFPFLTYFPVVVLVTFFCGLWPGLVSGVFCGLMAWYFFIAPFHAFSLDAPSAVALCLYTFIVGTDIGFIHSMHRLSERLIAEEARSRSLREQQQVLFEELQHRVANNIQFILATLDMHRRQALHSPEEAVAAIDSARSRLSSMAQIHRTLHNPDCLNEPLGPLLKKLCDQILHAAGASHVQCEIDVPDARLDLARMTSISLLVAEAVTNSLKHAFPGHTAGKVFVSLQEIGGGVAVLTIADNGQGMPPGHDRQRERGLGQSIMQNLALQLGGVLNIDGRDGMKTTLTFPLDEPHGFGESSEANPVNAAETAVRRKANRPNAQSRRGNVQ